MEAQEKNEAKRNGGAQSKPGKPNGVEHAQEGGVDAAGGKEWGKRKKGFRTVFCGLRKTKNALAAPW